MKKLILLLIFATSIVFSQTTTTTVGSLKINNIPPTVSGNTKQLVRNPITKIVEEQVISNGNPFTLNQTNAITGANTPSGTNVFATLLDLSLKQNSLFGVGRVVQNGSTTTYDNSPLVTSINGQTGAVNINSSLGLIGTTTGNDTTNPINIKGMVIDYNPILYSQSIVGNAAGLFSLAIGSNTTAFEEGSIAIGTDCIGYEPHTIGIGQDVYCYGSLSNAIGTNINLNKELSIGIGSGINLNGIQSIAIGNNINSSYDFNTSLGSNIYHTSDNQFVLSATNGTKNIRVNTNVPNDLLLDLPLSDGRLALESQILAQSPTDLSYDSSNNKLISSTGTGTILPLATTTDDGLLSNTDKIKIDSTSGINTGDNATNTQYSGLITNATHTGDATGATVLTLATVNANVGSFTNANLTVNAKGLVTSASNGTAGQPQINGTGFVKANGTAISFDNSTYLSSINSANVTTALGFTPYNATNPNGFISSVPAQSFVSLTSKPTTLSGYGITDAYPLSGNPSGFLINSALAPYLTSAIASTTYQPIGSYLTSFTEIDSTVKAINGIVKSNGTTISSATPGTDYALPNQNTTGTASNITGNLPQNQVLNLTTDLATKQNNISLTTTGTGAATFVGNVINIPTVSGSTKFNQTITSGTSIALANFNNQYLYVNPASLLTNYTVTLPTTPADGDIIFIAFGGTIAPNNSVVSNLTILPSAGSSIYQSVTPLTANGGDWFKYVYNQSNLTFYRQNL